MSSEYRDLIRSPNGVNKLCVENDVVGNVFAMSKRVALFRCKFCQWCRLRALWNINVFKNQPVLGSETRLLDPSSVVQVVEVVIL